ncbi:MAG TPA: DUF4349 domain-containing protein [Anaerolineae bacterium]|nr:DUF4349 domain-containing protein [Anaerolineae bacterium]
MVKGEISEMRKAFCLIAVAAVLAAVVGCAPKAMPERAPKMEVPVVKEVEVMPAPAPTPRPVADLGLAPLEERMIISRASLSLVVKDVEGSLEEIRAIVEGLGGYVVSSNSWYEKEQLRARLTVRVPAKELDAALERFKALAIEVERESISGEDVTEEYTDLESRLRNLEAAEKQLLKIMEQAEETEDVLAVYRELVNIRGQIEQTKGRMQYLERMSAMATIDLDLIPDVLAKPLVAAGWRPAGTLAAALRALIRTLQLIADMAIWFVVYALPILILVAIPLALLWFAWRRWRARRRAQ